MADRFVDQTGVYPAYAATPTWGVAQDGDGNASGVATPATCSVVFTGIPSSGTIAVLGITVSPTWATDASTCANNLATSINALATVAVSPAGITRKSQVRNHLFARGPAGGAPAGTCQIMMRQGTAAVNDETAVTHTLNNVSSPGTITFSGGASGAWAYLTNVGGTIWPQAVAISAYGLWCATLPYCGALLPGDRVRVRANNATIATNNATLALNIAAQGSLADPIVYELDNGSTWGDAADSGLLLAINNPNGPLIDNQSMSGSAFVTIVGGTRTNGTKRLRFGFTGVLGGSGTGIQWRVTSDHTFIGCEFFLPFIGPPAPQIVFRDVSNALLRLVDCLVSSAQPTPFFTATFGAGSRWSIEGGEFRNASSLGVVNSAPHAGVVQIVNAAESVGFYGTRFTDFVTGSRLASSGITVSVHAVDCQMGGLTVRAPCVHTSAYNTNWRNRQVVIQSQQGARDFSIDTTLGLAEWSSVRSFPVRAALQFNGVDKWSIRFCASTQSGTAPSRPWVLPRVSKVNPLATASRTVTAHFVLEKNLAWTTQDIFLRVHYTDSTGKPRMVTTWPTTPGTLPSDEMGEWSQYGTGLDAANVTWDDSGTIFHKQYKLSVVCPDMVIGTEVGVHLVLARSVSNTTQGGFLDPEIDIV